MTIHKEGYKTIAVIAIAMSIIILLSFQFLSGSYPILCAIISLAAIGFLLFIISFFRIPTRTFAYGENLIIAPADGKVVTIEEVQADEYFTDKRIQVSIFMSPLNVHVNRNPISGEIIYNKYHPGKFLVAWHPKSSTDNERHCVAYRKNGKELLLKQIAGAVARRIVNYTKVGEQVKQNEEMGFIKLGSRVDLLLPLNAKILVKVGDISTGGITPVATW